MKLQTNSVADCVVDVLRGADLFHHALVEDRHPVAHGQRLVLVVGDVDRGDAELALQVLELLPQLVPELGVQVGQRFVQQQDLGLQDQCPGDGHALLLARRTARPRSCRSCSSESSTRLAMSRTSLSLSADFSLRTRKPKAMFSATLMLGNRA